MYFRIFLWIIANFALIQKVLGWFRKKPVYKERLSDTSPADKFTQYRDDYKGINRNAPYAPMNDR